MKKFEKNVLCFDNYANMVRNKDKNQWYDCYVTDGRLSGFCDLLICEKGRRSAELFCLSFTPEGLTRHIHLKNEEKIKKWIDSKQCSNIIYLQALGLLGDAVRQNYKYKIGTDWINQDNSIHLQRIWMEEFYNDACSNMDWILSKQDELAILQAYLRALGHKDAALIYDLIAEKGKGSEPRGLYALCWNHTLEDLVIFEYELMEQLYHEEQDDRTLFLTTYGEYKKQQLLSVDLSLRVIRENGFLRILQERVLEARTLC